MGDGENLPLTKEFFPFLTGLEILPAWEAAARLFLERGGAVMVLGAPDTGKSTLSHYLGSQAVAAGRRAALVDLDLGQSHLGPPATLGLGLFPPLLPGEGSLSPQGLYFVGQTSPPGAILEVAVGCRVLADEAARQGVGRLVVNTSGFVQGPAAWRLKRAQAELLRPRLILALQRERELEPMIRALGGATAGQGEDAAWQILRLPVSGLANRRDPETRRLYREARFRGYFHQAGELRLPWASFSWQGLPLGQGPALPPARLGQIGQVLGAQVLYGEAEGRRLVVLTERPPLVPQTPEAAGLPTVSQLRWLSWEALQLRLVGLLNATRQTLALGLILPVPWNRQTLNLLTPLAPEAKSRVRFVKLGKLRLNQAGQELPQV